MTKVSDMNVLYDGFRKAMKSSPWKEDPQRFEIDFLSEIRKLSKEIENHQYQTSPTTEFIINERGKIRHIHGGRMRDRVVRHVLCDSVLDPTIEPYIIRYNCASQVGKGVEFARNAFERDLHNFWLKERTVDGWVALLDFSKYYDNIPHEPVKEMIGKMVDEESAWLFSNIIDNFQIDVSYMSDEEYAGCMAEKFNSVEYYNSVPKELRTGEKFLKKSVDIGDQVSQHVGVFYPTPIDNYITIVSGCRMYGRYMDDMWIIHKDRAFLEKLVKEVREMAAQYGLFINEKKTRILPIAKTFTFLQMKYRVTDTGRVVRKINQKSVTRERRRLKGYKRLLEKGEMEYPAIEQHYKSWMGRYTKVMSKKQIKGLQELYQSLYGRNPRWKA